MSVCILFGGAGFVGTHLAKHFLESKRFNHIHIADINDSPLVGVQGISFSKTDVREEIISSLIAEEPEWIFNLAAIHREPGHLPNEYFETNIKGAHNICNYANKVNCKNIYFTSSISVYGPVYNPTDEYKIPMPSTPYGSSKYPAELIHQIWLRASIGRRLIITRPGVIYGPGDPGNIMRMIKAIRKGYFIFPGSKSIHKSYAYIYGLLESIDFTMRESDDLIIYNYVETPTETIEELTKIIKEKMDSKAPILSLPSFFLVPLAGFLEKLFKKNNPIHPVRVKKAATPTHIIPRVLKERGFQFNYDFSKSIDHWQKVSIEDFN